ncbi:hypothetical protein [Ectobacillus sp. sgz5001026]|uniref:hypothetical protein n=1 Tax=Ectobacillus sp. sgz5001026 TaxID=3242473 RepID=UPI0036D29E2D
MFIAGLLLVASTVVFFVYYVYFRSWKQVGVLLSGKGNLARQSHFLVCSKCGRAHARHGGYQECCGNRL